MEALITVPSHGGTKETIARLEAAIRSHGMEIFARVDHAAGAAAAGMALPPMEVLFFGNARAGTPLMQMDATMGLELPLKMLVWQDAAGQTMLAYHDPHWLAQRHGLGEAAGPIIDRMDAALAALAKEAAGV